MSKKIDFIMQAEIQMSKLEATSLNYFWGKKKRKDEIRIDNKMLKKLVGTFSSSLLDSNFIH